MQNPQKAGSSKIRSTGAVSGVNRPSLVDILQKISGFCYNLTVIERITPEVWHQVVADFDQKNLESSAPSSILPNWVKKEDCLPGHAKGRCWEVI